jgi:hypothetical protein
MAEAALRSDSQFESLISAATSQYAVLFRSWRGSIFDFESDKKNYCFAMANIERHQTAVLDENGV